MKKLIIIIRFLLLIFKEKKIDVLFECVGLSGGISKKIVETALKKKIHVQCILPFVNLSQ